MSTCTATTKQAPKQQFTGQTVVFYVLQQTSSGAEDYHVVSSKNRQKNYHQTMLLVKLSRRLFGSSPASLRGSQNRTKGRAFEERVAKVYRSMYACSVCLLMRAYICGETSVRDLPHCTFYRCTDTLEKNVWQKIFAWKVLFACEPPVVLTTKISIV